MTRTITRNLAASVRQRLLVLAKKREEPFDLVLSRYSLERLLYRISRSKWRDRFLLKGAMLFLVWHGTPHRPTRDLDLMGYGANDVGSMEEVFQSICSVKVKEDGIEFSPASVRGMEIRDNSEYRGVRIQLRASLAGANIPIQVDIGFGDIVTPDPEEIWFPTLLEFPAPKLRTYTKYSMVSEKFQAMVMLGIANSRMKDFYDLWFIANEWEFFGVILGRAIKATFDRRNTPLTAEIPYSLTDSFSEDPIKRRQWEAFKRKNLLSKEGKAIFEVINLLRDFLVPPFLSAAKREKFNSIWPAGGPWKKKNGNNR